MSNAKHHEKEKAHNEKAHSKTDAEKGQGHKAFDPTAPHPGEVVPESSSGVTPEEKAEQEQKAAKDAEKS